MSAPGRPEVRGDDGEKGARRDRTRMEVAALSGFEVEPRVQTFDAESGNYARPGTHFMRRFLLTDAAIAKCAR